jgi:hypothetical protein
VTGYGAIKVCPTLHYCRGRGADAPAVIYARAPSA